MGSAALKVQGGKLLKARVETSGGRIASLKLTGDFFLHPEETLAEIETALTNHQLNESAITATISSLLQKNNAQLIGAAPEDFAKVIMEASK